MGEAALKLDPPDIEQLQEVDKTCANLVLAEKGEAVNQKRLNEGIKDDWEAVMRMRRFAELLPETEKENIGKVVRDTIRRFSELFKTEAAIVIPKSAKNKKGEIKKNMDPFSLLIEVNRHLEQTDIAPETAAKVAQVKKLIVTQIKQALIIAAGKIVNENINKYSEAATPEMIAQLLDFIKDDCIPTKVEDISFYVLDESNQFEERKYFTKIKTEKKQTKDRKRSQIIIKNIDLSKGDSSESDINAKERQLMFETKGAKITKDEATNTLYYPVKMGDRYLGCLKIKLKEEQNLSTQEIEYIEQALQRLDNTLDDRLREGRHDYLAKLALEIFERHGEGKFENSIADLVETFCKYNRAVKAEVYIDMDEDKAANDNDRPNIFAKSFDDFGQRAKIEKIPGKILSDKIVQTPNRIEIPIYDPSSCETKEKGETGKRVIGKIIFKTGSEKNTLTYEDTCSAKTCADLLSHHIAHWRSNLKIATKGVDSSVARLIMKDNIPEAIKKGGTVYVVDLAGFSEKTNQTTKICERDFKDDPELNNEGLIIKKLQEDFLGTVQEIIKEFGGIWDKAMGDAALCIFGFPVDKEGVGPLGKDHNEEDLRKFYIMQTYMAHLVINSKLGEISEKFKISLLKIASRKYPQIAKIEDEKEREEKLLTKLKKDTGLSPEIKTTAAFFSGAFTYGCIRLKNAEDWTAIGNVVNSTARAQKYADAGEELKDAESADVIDEFVKSDTPIPLNNQGDTITWKKFCKKYLGRKDAPKPRRSEKFVGFKNIPGMHRVVQHDLPLEKKKIPTITKGAILTGIDQLLAYEGLEFGISEIHPESNQTKLKLNYVNAHGKQIEFWVILPAGSIKKDATLYTSPRELQDREENKQLKTLKIESGSIKRYQWKSIGLLQSKAIQQIIDDNKDESSNEQPSFVINENLTPAGCYVCDKYPSEDSSVQKNGDDQEEIIELKKGNSTLNVKLALSKVKSGKEAFNTNKHLKRDFLDYYDALKTTYAENDNIIFVQHGNFYLISAQEIKEICKKDENLAA